MKKWLPIIVILILIVFQFYPTLKPNHLFATSGDAAYSSLWEHLYPQSFYHNWIDHYYLGYSPGNESINLTRFFFVFLPSKIAYRLQWIFPIFLFFLFAWIYGSRNKEKFYSRFFLAISLTFSPIYASFIFVGHPLKLLSIPFFILTLYFLEKYFESKKTRDMVYVGIALGISFASGAIQTVFYWSLVLSAYFIWQWINGQFSNLKDMTYLRSNIRHLIKFFFVPIIALFFAFPALYGPWLVKNLTNENILGLEETTSSESSEQKNSQNWDWATQWSFPPEETFDFLATGFFGYKTGDPENPYWGRTGRSPSWTLENPKGFQNFSFSSNYMGFLTIFLAFCSLLFIRHKQVQFWWFIVCLSLLLAFGRFSFVYVLFYKLPIIDSFRNPNKFLHIMFIPMHLLAYFTFSKIEEAIQSKEVSHLRYIPKILYALFSLVTVVFLVVLIGDDLTAYLRKSYGTTVSNAIFGNVIISYFRFFLMTVLLGIPIVLLIKKQYSQKIVTGLFLFLLVVSFLDVWNINHKFLEYREYPKEETPDQITQFFLKEMEKGSSKEPFRIKVINRGRYTGHFMTTITPRYRIASLDPPAESRPPSLFYQGYYKYMDMNNLKSYEILNVKFFMALTPLNHPNLILRLQMSHPATRESIFIYELKNHLPKIQTVHQYFEETNTIATFDIMKSALFDPKKAVVHNEMGGYDSFYPKVDNLSNVNQSSALITTYDADLIKCKVNMEENGCLVLTDLHHPDWRAYVNGEQKTITRVNFFMRGLLLEKGEYEVVFKYQPSLFTFYLSLVGFVLMLSFAGYYFFRLFKT